MTGAITPDATGEYIDSGIYGGNAYYQRRDGQWFIWSTSTIPGFLSIWYITLALGSVPNSYWTKFTMPAEPPPGDYLPQSGAIGIATVATP